jgi:branched-chain amino acid aminotransferase
MTINDFENGPITMAMRDGLLGIQHGTTPDTHGWMHKVC